MSVASSRSIFRCCHSASYSPLSAIARPSLTASSRIARRRRSISSTSKRWASAEATDATSTNPKIAEIVDRIGSLTLLETADLVSTLKVSSSWRRPDLTRLHPSDYCRHDSTSPICRHSRPQLLQVPQQQQKQPHQLKRKKMLPQRCKRRPCSTLNYNQ